MTATKSELVDLSDFAWRRLRGRLDGMTNEEYLWEPVAGCWTIRQRPDGTWAADMVLPGPDPAPFTTIAWRLWHLIDMYGEDRAPRLLDVEPQGPAIGIDDPDGRPPATSAEAIELLERAHDRWDRHLALVPEERLQEQLGRAGGQYAEQTRAAYVLHMLDEYIHHGAEIGVLRDLWRWQHPVASDPLEDAIVRGDHRAIDRLRDAADRSAGTGDAGLVDRAAAYGRWDLVLGLARLGFPVDTPGRTPLHLAAGAGELAVVKALVELGADTDVRDPQFDATPAQWAAFLNRTSVVDWLSSRAERSPTSG